MLVATVGVRCVLAVQQVAHPAGSGQASCRRGHKGRWVDRGHPDSGLVDLEQIGDQGVEVDVGVREVVEGEFLPVPA